MKLEIKINLTNDQINSIITELIENYPEVYNCIYQQGYDERESDDEWNVGHSYQ